MRLIDATPVPCGASRQTVKRSELAGWPAPGTAPPGSPRIGECEVAAELMAHAARTGARRPGLTLIGDKGFAGRDFKDLATAGYALRPDRRDEIPRHGSIGWIRPWTSPSTTP